MARESVARHRAIPTGLVMLPNSRSVTGLGTADGIALVAAAGTAADAAGDAAIIGVVGDDAADEADAAAGAAGADVSGDGDGFGGSVGRPCGNGCGRIGAGRVERRGGEVRVRRVEVTHERWRRRDHERLRVRRVERGVGLPARSTLADGQHHLVAFAQQADTAARTG